MRGAPVPALLVALSALAAAGCTSTDTACPAIGWFNAITVRLAPAWPVADRTVTLSCPAAEDCGGFAPGGAPPTAPQDAVTVPLVDAAAEVTIGMRTPASVTVTVSAGGMSSGGAVLAAYDAPLDWERVGGTAACGGPEAATVVVPAP
jgi:hypothetical protein